MCTTYKSTLTTTSLLAMHSKLKRMCTNSVRGIGPTRDPDPDRINPVFPGIPMCSWKLQPLFFDLSVARWPFIDGRSRFNTMEHTLEIKSNEMFTYGANVCIERIHSWRGREVQARKHAKLGTNSIVVVRAQWICDEGEDMGKR